MTGIRDLGVVAYAVCASLAALVVVESASAQDADLRIVVIEGEDSVNIIAQGTAVPAVVEVRTATTCRCRELRCCSCSGRAARPR